MKQYRPLVAAINKCNYCGSLVITLDDCGQCPKGCPGNMREVLQDTYFLDMKTGQLHYSVPEEKQNIELLEPAQDDISEIQERVRDEDGLELSRSSIRRMMAQDDGKPEVGDLVWHYSHLPEICIWDERDEQFKEHYSGKIVVIMRAAEVKRRIEEAKE